MDAMGELDFAQFSKAQEPEERGARTKHHSKAHLWRPKAFAGVLNIPSGGQHFTIA